MATTNSLARTVNLASVMNHLKPLSNVGGFALEPALSLADWTRNFILSPPFAWRWNRATYRLTVGPDSQDYKAELPKFGWLERASVTDTNGVVHELEVALNLGESSAQNLPVKIAARLDDNQGNITFRVLPLPDKSYTVQLSYQLASPLFVQLTDTWAPIPDYLSYLYNQGFVAKVYEYGSDERFLPTMQLFVRQVIAANSGLSDTQINIFMEDRVNTTRTGQSELQSSQAGRQGRGAF
jgi:hypothetical protein